MNGGHDVTGFVEFFEGSSLNESVKLGSGNAAHLLKKRYRKIEATSKQLKTQEVYRK